MEDKLLIYVRIDGSIRYVKDPVKADMPEYLVDYKGPVFWKNNSFVSDRTKRTYCVLWVPRTWDIKDKVLNYTAFMNRIGDKNLMEKLESNEIVKPIDISNLSDRIFIKAENKK